MKRRRKQIERCPKCGHPAASFDRQLGFCGWQLDDDRLCGCKCPGPSNSALSKTSKPKEKLTKMKRKLLALLLLLAVLATVAWTPPKAECFACTREAKSACIEEANNVYWACWDVYGDMGDAICNKRMNEYVDTCYMMHGCPIPPRNP